MSFGCFLGVFRVCFVPLFSLFRGFVRRVLLGVRGLGCGPCPPSLSGCALLVGVSSFPGPWRVRFFRSRACGCGPVASSLRVGGCRCAGRAGAVAGGAFVKPPVWFVGGSRSLPLAGARVVSVLAAALAVGPGLVSVGCAPGADAAFAGCFAARGLARRLSVAAVGGPSGLGFLSPVAGRRVVALGRAGASVVWSAGGGGAVPFRARLARRSRVAVSLASAGALLVVSSPSSRGSLLSASVAARAGLSVRVWCVGFCPSLLPSLAGCPGSWRPFGAVAGVPCVLWVPAQPRLF